MLLSASHQREVDVGGVELGDVRIPDLHSESPLVITIQCPLDAVLSRVQWDCGTPALEPVAAGEGDDNRVALLRLRDAFLEQDRSVEGGLSQEASVDAHRGARIHLPLEDALLQLGSLPLGQLGAQLLRRLDLFGRDQLAGLNVHEPVVPDLSACSFSGSRGQRRHIGRHHEVVLPDGMHFPAPWREPLVQFVDRRLPDPAGEEPHSRRAGQVHPPRPACHAMVSHDDVVPGRDEVHHDLLAVVADLRRGQVGRFDEHELRPLLGLHARRVEKDAERKSDGEEKTKSSRHVASQRDRDEIQRSAHRGQMPYNSPADSIRSVAVRPVTRFPALTRQ